MSIQFEWDEEKASGNKEKHCVSFEEARTIFNDPFAITIADPDHSAHEDRWLDIGFSSQGRLLVVWYAERSGSIRIIGSRRATKAEERVSQMSENEHRPDEMREEYDFSAGVRGKHYKSWRAGHTVVVTKADGSIEQRHFTLQDGAVMLDPDLRVRFPDSESVNMALRSLVPRG